MASKKTVNAENLTTLGAPRLAAILLDLAAEQAAVKRRLRLELAGQEGGEQIAAEITKRITSLRNAKSYVHWQRRPEFVRDLDMTRSMIVENVAAARPDLALDLMWRFMELAKAVFARVDDSRGTISAVFRAACDDLGPLAVKAKPSPDGLAERVFQAVTQNDYGEYDQVIAAIFPALGKAGSTALRRKLQPLLAQRSAASGPMGGDVGICRALADLADAEGDVDAYIAALPQDLAKLSFYAAQIGQRLVAAGRAAEAIRYLEAARPQPRAAGRMADAELYLLDVDTPDEQWQAAYIDALAATGQPEEAQRLRWSGFEERLSVAFLRTYLRALPDFDDVIASDRAMELALKYPSFPMALTFFHEWPEPRYAARLVIERHGEIDGNMYYLLTPVAQWLENTQPLAATLLRRALINDTLEGSKSTRYKHAAKHLAECASLAPLIEHFGQFESHAAYEKRLREGHSRKTSFWLGAGSR